MLRHIWNNISSATKRFALGRSALLLMAMSATQTARAELPDDLSTLSLETLLQLRVTVVGASKYEQKQSEVASSVSVITRNEINTFGWRTVSEALASLPGVHNTYNHIYDYVGTRAYGQPGTLTERMLVTINGNRVNDPTYDLSPVGREFPVDMALIEQIEFFPGPGSATYGHNAMLGVVNIVTRKGADLNGAELMLSAERLHHAREGRLSWGKRFKNGVDLLISTSGLRAKGADRYFEFGESGVSGVAAGLDRERLQQFYARVSQGPVSAELIQSSRRKDDPTGSFFSDPLVADQFEHDIYRLANLQYEDNFLSNTLRLSGRLFVGHLQYNGLLSYDGEGYAYPAVGHWRGTEWRLLSTAWANHKIVLGLEAQTNIRTEQAELVLTNTSFDSRVRKSGYRVGLFAQDEWRMHPDVTATLGLRADRSDNGRTAISPRLALIWQAAPPTTLKMLMGRAHRDPNFSERDFENNYAIASNPGLRGERLENVEAIVDHLVNDDLSVRASMYRWTIKDLIVQGIDPVTGFAQFQTGTGMVSRGLELSANKTWAGGLQLRGSLSLQQSARLDASISQSRVHALARLNVSKPLPWAGLKLAYELRIDDARPDLTGAQAGAYAISNVHLTTSSLAPGLEVSVTVRNLFDKRYAHPVPEASWQNTLEQNRRELRFTLVQRF